MVWAFQGDTHPYWALLMSSYVGNGPLMPTLMGRGPIERVWGPLGSGPAPLGPRRQDESSGPGGVVVGWPEVGDFRAKSMVYAPFGKWWLWE